MKIIDLNMNSDVLRGSKDDAYKCIKESFAILEAANAMVQSLIDWEETFNLTRDVYSSIQVVNAEKLLYASSTPAIDMYRMAGLSKVPALSTRLSVYMEVRDQLTDILDNIVDAYIELNNEEKKAVKQLSIKIMEQLSFFLFYEFNLDITSSCLQNNQELEVNEAIKDYVGRESLNLYQKILFLLEIYIKYRPSIPSFDLTDDEIDNFYFHTGVFAHQILDDIDDFDSDVVRKLASGELSPEEVIEQLTSEREVEHLDLFS